MVEHGIISWGTCIFLVYTQTFRKMGIPRKFKQQVGYSLAYHLKSLHNYLMPSHTKCSHANTITHAANGMGGAWLHWVYNSYPVYWFTIFSVAWNKIIDISTHYVYYWGPVRVNSDRRHSSETATWRSWNDDERQAADAKSWHRQREKRNWQRHSRFKN